MELILRGIMRYRNTTREKLVNEILKICSIPQPKAIFFTCMDNCMIPTGGTESQVGNMFVVRNAGNVIPHAKNFEHDYCSCEPAALELGCILYNIHDVIICGHSNCKSMNLLYQLRDPSIAMMRYLSPTCSWLWSHANTSLSKYFDWKSKGMQHPLQFTAETTARSFEAFIDPTDKLSADDKLSQINTLQQLSNIASYDFLKERLESNTIDLHALWYDSSSGVIYYFSRTDKRFIAINESSVVKLSEEMKFYYY